MRDYMDNSKGSEAMEKAYKKLLEIGMWGFLVLSEFILNFSEYTGGEMAVLFVIIGFFVCVGYFIIVLPMSLLSEKIARAPLRLIKAMLVHVLPAVICPLIWVYFVLNRDVNWEVALFGVFAFPYWILDELLRKRNSCY